MSERPSYMEWLTDYQNSLRASGQVPEGWRPGARELQDMDRLWYAIKAYKDKTIPNRDNGQQVTDK